MEEGMHTKQKTFVRWHLIVSYLGIITLMLACSGVALGSTANQTLQIDDGVVQVKN